MELSPNFPFPSPQIQNNRQIGLEKLEYFYLRAPRKKLALPVSLAGFVWWCGGCELRKQDFKSRSSLNQTANLDGCECMFCFGKTC